MVTYQKMSLNKKHPHFVCLLLLPAAIFSQSIKDSIAPSLKIGEYLESYYVYDFGRPLDHNRPSFVYSHHRHHEVNIQMALIRASYTTTRMHAYLAAMAGTYAQRNMAA